VTPVTLGDNGQITMNAPTSVTRLSDDRQASSSTFWWTPLDADLTNGMSDEQCAALFASYATAYKLPVNVQDPTAKANFCNGLRSILNTNQLAGSTFTRTANGLLHMDPSTLHQRLTGDKTVANNQWQSWPKPEASSITTLDSLPSSVDWTSIMTPARNQGFCGDCWAFATCGAIEGMIGVKNGAVSNVILAPEQLVDCASDNNNYPGLQGCNGGSNVYGMQWAADNGLPSESDEPYQMLYWDSKTQAETGTCPNPMPSVAAQPTAAGAVDCPSDETLMQMLSIGPVAVSVAVDDSWMSYSGGIIDIAGPTIDHAVVAVGYGADSNGNGYWKFRNSWFYMGQNNQWTNQPYGDNGYFLLKRDGTGFAGITGSQGVCVQPSM